MANEVKNAVDSVSGQRVRLTDSFAAMNRRAAQVGRNTQAAGDAGKALMAFAQTGLTAFHRQKQEDAEKKANQIIAELTPEQRRQAIESGKLLYQDDAEAMRVLNYKIGRDAAFEVEADFQRAVLNGAFAGKSREEVLKERQTMLQKAAQDLVKDWGVPAKWNSQFQVGFNDSIEERTRSTVKVFDEWNSNYLIDVAKTSLGSDLNSFAANPGNLMDPEGAKYVAELIQTSLVSGAAPTESVALDVLGSHIRNVAKREGASVHLQELGEQVVHVRGGNFRIKDLMGEASWTGVIAEAEQADFERNHKTASDWSLSVHNATLASSPYDGLAALDKLGEHLDAMQPSELTTPQRNQLVSARQALLTRMAQAQAENNSQRTKAIQSYNRQLVIEDVRRRAENGELVNTDHRAFPINESTGNFTDDDLNIYAANRINAITSTDEPMNVKAAKLMKELRLDPRDGFGGFKMQLQGPVDKALADWQAQIISKDQPDPAKLEHFEQVLALYEADPTTFGMVYPEAAGEMEVVRHLRKSGLEYPAIINAQRANRDPDPESRRARSQAWLEVTNDSRSAIGYLPTEMQEVAKTIFDAQLYTTGNFAGAKKNTMRWLDENTVAVWDGAGNGVKDTRGVIPKTVLMLDPGDTESWKEGEKFMYSALAEAGASNPAFADLGEVSVRSVGDGMILADTPMGDFVMIDMNAAGEDYRKRKAEEGARLYREAAEKAMSSAGSANAQWSLYNRGNQWEEAGKRIRDRKARGEPLIKLQKPIKTTPLKPRGE